jgi:hypothetical protein
MLPTLDIHQLQPAVNPFNGGRYLRRASAGQNELKLIKIPQWNQAYYPTNDRPKDDRIMNIGAKLMNKTKV